jgi:hypothetical protein
MTWRPRAVFPPDLMPGAASDRAIDLAGDRCLVLTRAGKLRHRGMWSQRAGFRAGLEQA